MPKATPHGKFSFCSSSRPSAHRLPAVPATNRWTTDHVFRHRAPLFMALVDPQRLCVIRATERVLVPERGARLGELWRDGGQLVTETWVTAAEWMQPRGVEKRGSDNRVLGWRRSSGTDRTWRRRLRSPAMAVGTDAGRPYHGFRNTRIAKTIGTICRRGRRQRASRVTTSGGS